jgi:hypothetical protein
MEKKKIIARKIASADEQENALQTLLNLDKPKSQIVASEKKTSEPQSTDKVVKETKPKPPPPVAVRQPRTVRRKVQDMMKPPVEVQRVTIDLPADLYDLLKKEMEEKGTTLRWQIISLVRDHFKKA